MNNESIITKVPLSSFIRLLGFLKPYRKRLALTILLIALAEGTRVSLVWVTTEALQPILDPGFESTRSSWFVEHLKHLTTRLIISDHSAMTQLIAVCTGVALLTLMRGLFFFAHSYCANWVGQRLLMDLRHKVFSHFHKLSLGFFENRATGKLISNMTNDVSALAFLINIGIQDVIAQPLLIVGCIILMVCLSWKLSLFIAVIVPLIALTIWLAGKRIRKIMGEFQATLADLTSVLTESLSGIRVIQLFSMQQHEIERFDRESQKAYRQSMRNVRVRAGLMPLVEFLVIGGLVSTILFGGWQVLSTDWPAENLFRFMAYFYFMGTSFKKISAINSIKEHITAAAERIFQVLDTKPEIEDTTDAITLQSPHGQVSFQNVNFVYPEGSPVLRDISFDIKPGKTTALVGPSGGGKTTIAHLIPRLYKPSSGIVLFDGIDVQQITMLSLRESIGFVPQDTSLFDGTVNDNIGYGKLDATPDEIIEAAKTANAHNFIIKLDGGYNGRIGEDGVRLSAGERQRISIARAILRNPTLLILDEATSNLDTESETAVQKALENAVRGRTAVIIAHRLSTIRNADHILVINEGTVVEEGSHQELLDGNGLYRRLYELQFSS